jgi:hypothetical protein
MPKMTIAERRAERQAIREEAIAIKKANPKATAAQIKAELRTRWGNRGIDPDKVKRWLEILMELLPLILKLFA